MGCPEGCVSGGGQPKLLLETLRKKAYQARKSSVYRHDSHQQVRKSHENPAIMKLYKDFLGEPLGNVSHHLLHTTFHSREQAVSPLSASMKED
ncbi:Iron hydrogenase 1 [compost metagenome]